MHDFRAPPWLPGGHVQTIWPVFFSRRYAGERPAFERERWSTPDGDFIDVDWLGRDPEATLLVLFHGLEGSSASHYAEAFAADARQRGWRFAVPHFRGCSGELNLAPRAYHSGDWEEVGWLLGRFRALHRGPIVAVGVSLGGNALLRYAEEAGASALERVRAIAAISAPLDLDAGATAIGRGFGLQVYTRMFLRSMKPKALRKLAQHPGPVRRRAAEAGARPARLRRRLHCAAARLSRRRRLLRARLGQAAARRRSAFRRWCSTRATTRSCPARRCRARARSAATSRSGSRSTAATSASPAAAGRAISAPCPSRSWGGSTGIASRAPRQADNRPMDPIVAAALKKWPNVPHCYGWLALDARGDWYMRDDRIQAAGPFPRVKGSRIEHEKLREFIARNYGHDESGAWFFQNGPQRVYVELEAAPYVWRLAAAAAGSRRRSPATSAARRASARPRSTSRAGSSSTPTPATASSTRSTWRPRPTRSSAATGRPSRSPSPTCRRASAIACAPTGRRLTRRRRRSRLRRRPAAACPCSRRRRPCSGRRRPWC